MAAAATSKPDMATADPWARAEGLPCLLTVEIPVPGFTVRDLVQLSQGRVIATRWVVGEDAPMLVNGQLIAWCEFEVVQGHLAIRLTELA